MVMTLRKRVAPAYAAESESESESDTVIPIAAPPKRKKKRSKKEDDEEEEEISSEAESESDESGSSEKENEVGVGYENVREQRIRENRERMEKLGIFTLSSQLYNAKKPKSKPPKKAPAPKRKRYPPLYPRSRRSSSSSRGGGGGGGQYLKSEGLLEDLGISIPEGWKAELYTEEDEKLLGDCQAPWTLKADGFSDDGDRLYDPDGPPCHQCRQKVLAKLTFCVNCRSPHGVLCGDCLYTRYGENVLEAVQNPSWSCPVCRGICNCSRCRRTKGWEPVNIPHSKLIEKGFKSVAHYLILTRRAGATPKDWNEGIVTVDLTTEDTTAPQQDEGSDYSAESSESGSDDSDSDDDSKGKKESKEQSIEVQVSSAEMSDEAAVANDEDQVLQEPENLEASLAL